MSTSNLAGRKSSRRVGLTTLPPSMSRMSENGASTSRNPKGLHGLDNFTLPYDFLCFTISKKFHRKRNEKQQTFIRIK
jgi:hypothetical protein